MHRAHRSTHHHSCNTQPPSARLRTSRLARDRSLARTMPLIYAFVARRTTVLAEYTNYSGNFSTIATQVRPRAVIRAVTRAGAREGVQACPRSSRRDSRVRARARIARRDERGGKKDAHGKSVFVRQ